MTDNEIIERNRAVMRRFEKCINTNDLALGEELISAAAAFTAPFSPVPLYGAKGYLSVVDFMRRSFPDVHWTLENMVADKKNDCSAMEMYWNVFRDSLFRGASTE